MISEILTELAQLYGDKQVLIGGKYLFDSSFVLPANVTSFENLKAFDEFLKKV
jgi:hypothetical protein